MLTLARLPEIVTAHTVIKKHKSMRTKTLFLAALVAAVGVASSMAQSNVYSLNVVGYVNKPFVTGFNLIANPLNKGTNGLDEIMANANVPDNTIAFIWDTAAQDFLTLATYVSGSSSWIPNVNMPPGQGFFVLAPSDYTNTFVGEVMQGSISTTIAPSFNAIGSPVPIGGALSNVLSQMPSLDNDLVFQWDSTAQDFLNISTWAAGSSQWIPELTFGVGEGMFYLSGAAGNTNWVRTFTVQ